MSQIDTKIIDVWLYYCHPSYQQYQQDIHCLMTTAHAVNNLSTGYQQCKLESVDNFGL